MTQVISFISRKGGTGKTTNAIHLATSLAANKKKVILIETDTNYTLSTLRQIELRNKTEVPKNLFEIIGSTDAKVTDEITLLSEQKKLDYIIIDSAGKTTDKHIRELCLKSNLVIVPTSLSQNDLLVAFQTIQDLKPAQQINKNLKLLVLLNRLHSQTGKNTIEERTKALDVPILEVFVPQKNAIAQFSTMEANPDYHEIMKQILKAAK